MNGWIVGIDPGKKGAMCLLPPVLICSPIFYDFDRTSIAKLHSVLKDELSQIDGVAVEKVRSLPGMSARSNFSFGYAVSEIETVLRVVGLEFVRLLPRVWQTTCGITYPKKCPSKERKIITAAKARELYPSVPLEGPKGGLKDGRADALLIAHALKETINASKTKTVAS